MTFADDSTAGLLLLSEATNRAAEAVFNSILRIEGAREEILQPILRRFDPEGSTDDVNFRTRKAAIETSKSPVSHVVLDGPKGNTWEEALAGLLEANPKVAAYVKNDHLGFAVLYVHEGRTHEYLPDFLVRLVDLPDGESRTLIVEVSGGRKAPGPTAAKADAARHHWCPAVNNHGGYGRWAYEEIKDMGTAKAVLETAIDRLAAPLGEPATAGGH